MHRAAANFASPRSLERGGFWGDVGAEFTMGGVRLGTWAAR